MDKVNLGYSTKNIPIPGKKDYLTRLISSAEKVIRSIRWKTFFFLNPNNKPDRKETFGFNSTRNPPSIPELKEFEDEMLNMVQNIEFKNADNQFQRQLSNDIDDIKESSRLLIAADKTTNFYKVKPDQYKNLLEINITKDYRKAPETLEKHINLGDKAIATELELDDRINVTAKNQAFVTLKDHKPNFNNRPSCRLINPTKSEIGKISKQVLERINVKIRGATNLNQWKNTNEVINWFKNIEDKPQNSFICFDVCEFYPSITEELVTKALEFAENYDTITQDEKDIIKQAKKSLLFSNGTPWCKKGENNFDVTMGSFDGAETCELIGLYILYQIKHLDINVGLYRDDGLAVCNKSPKQAEQIKKEICKVFAKNKLKITIEANAKTVDFLDITMDLRTETYKPYMKPNNTPMYVHSKSNHPPNILKNIPESINRRLSSISCNATAFNDTAPVYQEALRKSGHNYKLKYNPPPQETTNPSASQKRKRKRKITWFNPPYSSNVTTNVGKKYLKLIDKCFPPDHKLHKLLNRSTLKVSYSCMPNTKQIISSHNIGVIKKSEPNETTQTLCNCRIQRNCPLEGKCLTAGIIYQATVTNRDNRNKETYIGLTEGPFKTRFTNHTSSFRHSEQRNSTTLSHYIWSLKDKSIPHTIQWRIVAKSNSYSNSSKSCNLCLKEKYFIIFKPTMATLNTRNELASTCRHRRKYLLSNVQG